MEHSFCSTSSEMYSVANHVFRGNSHTRIGVGSLVPVIGNINAKAHKDILVLKFKS